MKKKTANKKQNSKEHGADIDETEQQLIQNKMTCRLSTIPVDINASVRQGV